MIFLALLIFIIVSVVLIIGSLKLSCFFRRSAVILLSIPLILVSANIGLLGVKAINEHDGVFVKELSSQFVEQKYSLMGDLLYGNDFNETFLLYWGFYTFLLAVTSISCLVAIFLHYKFSCWQYFILAQTGLNACMSIFTLLFDKLHITPVLVTVFSVTTIILVLSVPVASTLRTTR